MTRQDVKCCNDENCKNLHGLQTAKGSNGGSKIKIEKRVKDGSESGKGTRYKCIKIRCPKKKMKYIQPPVPQSYAPVKQYERPSETMAGETVFKISYLPVKADLRRTPYVLTSNLKTPTGKFCDDTVHKLSFVPNALQPMTRAFKHCANELFGKGPMQDLTTFKHDYVPKPIRLRAPKKVLQQLSLSKKALEDETTYRLSYQGRCLEGRRAPFVPTTEYQPPTAQMECSTVQKLSYLPHATLPRWIPPWSLRPAYSKGCTPFNGETVYKNSYPQPGWYEEGSECSCTESEDVNSNYSGRLKKSNSCICIGLDENFSKISVNDDRVNDGGNVKKNIASDSSRSLIKSNDSKQLKYENSLKRNSCICNATSVDSISKNKYKSRDGISHESPRSISRSSLSYDNLNNDEAGCITSEHSASVRSVTNKKLRARSNSVSSVARSDYSVNNECCECVGSVKNYLNVGREILCN